jgi:hypothetical protein
MYAASVFATSFAFLSALTSAASCGSQDSSGGACNAPSIDTSGGMSGNSLVQLRSFVGMETRSQHLSNSSLPKCPTTPDTLMKYYDEIFPSKNRNAASFKWFSFIANCAQEVGQKAFEELGKMFCPISGSPTSGQNSAKVALGKFGGGKDHQEGAFYFCCEPCICDMHDFVKVDRKTIDFGGGNKKVYDVLVHGDPCKNPTQLSKPFKDSSGETTLAQVAPEVACDGGALKGATFSDLGHPIIGLFYSSPEKPTIDGTLSDQIKACKSRAASGYHSGMGLIFRKVASITPLATSG